MSGTLVHMNLDYGLNTEIIQSPSPNMARSVVVLFRYIFPQFHSCCLEWKIFLNLAANSVIHSTPLVLLLDVSAVTGRVAVPDI